VKVSNFYQEQTIKDPSIKQKLVQLEKAFQELWLPKIKVKEFRRPAREILALRKRNDDRFMRLYAQVYHKIDVIEGV
jgi:hypothetical protein